MPTFLVTGSNTGIGRAVVEALAAAGGNVVLASRSAERTLPVVEGIRRQHPDIDARFLQVDLSDFDSVRRAAGEYLASGHPLDVLVNNAAVAGTFGRSRQDYDLTIATNHLGPFLFTNLLLPRLEQSGAARIVNVASAAHLSVKTIDWSHLSRGPASGLSGYRAYALTKLMNVLHAKELARRLADRQVTTCALHPGVVASDLWRPIPAPLPWIMKLFMISNERGAKTPVWCATAPEVVSGRYYDKCREAVCSPLADDRDLARELWARSEEAVRG